MPITITTTIATAWRRYALCAMRYAEYEYEFAYEYD